MTKLSDSEMLAIVDAEFESAMGADGGEISAQRAEAWRYYLSEPFGNEIEGQSEVVSSDVADVVDSIMPSLLRIFTTADNLLFFKPVGPEDEDQAAQESDYVNYVFFKENPAFLILYTWFFDALVQKNGIVKAYWDESEVVTQETYKGLSDEELAELLDDDELEIIERSERQAPTVQDVSIEVAPGQAVQGQTIAEGTVHDVTFRRVSKRGRVRVEPVAPEEYRISADSRSVDPADARMVGQESEITRSALIEMGFDEDLVNDLPAVGDELRSEEAIARRTTADETFDAPHDKSQDKILVREGYIRVDYDGDGRSELRQAFTSNGHMLSNEPADRQPFHVISPQPLPHRHFGRATAEKVMDLQLINSTLVRQVQDNLYHTNNPSHAVWEQGIGENTLDDLLTTRVGSIKRFARPVQESYQPISVPFTAAATFPMLEYWEKVKRDRTGISSDGEGLSPEALKNIQTSVLAQSLDLSMMKIEAIARIFAETGMKSLFLHIHELLQKYQDKPKVVDLRNEWVEVSPQAWRTRLDMTVNIGLGIGTRQQNLLHLNAIWEKQSEIIQAGGFGTLVTPMNVYNTAAEIVKNANLKNPEFFFTPTEEVQQPSSEQEQLAKQQMELQQRQQQLDAERQQVQAGKLQLQAQKDQMDAQKMIADHRVDVEKLKLQNQEREDNLLIAMEKIATELTKIQADTGRDIPGAKI